MSGWRYRTKNPESGSQAFEKELDYTYLGNGEDRHGNSNIEVKYLQSHLTKKGYRSTLYKKDIHKFTQAANDLIKSLYERNKKVYSYLRYGVKVRKQKGDKLL